MKTVEERTYKTDVVTHVHCDFCDCAAAGDRFTSGFDVDEVTITYKTGQVYPEGGGGERLEVDCCPSCFEEKILPLLEKLAVRPFRKVEWDR